MSENQVTELLDPSFLERLRSVNDDFYDRITEKNQEFVKYIDGTSVRLWYNKESHGFKLHWHPAMEMTIGVEGVYTVRTQSQEYILHPGDILMLPSGELHEIPNPGSGSRVIMLFDNQVMSQLNGFASLAPFISKPVFIPYDNTDSLSNRCIGLINQIIREYVLRNPYFELVIASRFLSILVTIGRNRLLGDHNPNTFHDSKQNELSQKLSIAFEYIDSHYTDDLTLDDVADIAGFSKFHFSRLFKQCSGQNFHEYLCYKRIQASEALLMMPEYSITEIAFKSGFSSLSTFNRAFKNINQCSPTEYRNLNTLIPN